MTTAVNTAPTLTSQLVNGLLSIKPLANLAKHQARNMMIKRAEKIGVPWRQRVEELRTHDWDSELAEVLNSQLTYPEYYLCSFHAYEKGNLSWDAALEVGVASYTVHAGICPEDGAKGDATLRQSYHDIVKEKIPIQPQDIF